MKCVQSLVKGYGKGCGMTKRQRCEGRVVALQQRIETPVRQSSIRYNLNIERRDIEAALCNVDHHVFGYRSHPKIMT